MAIFPHEEGAPPRETLSEHIARNPFCALVSALMLGYLLARIGF